MKPEYTIDKNNPKLIRVRGIIKGKEHESVWLGNDARTENHAIVTFCNAWHEANKD